MILVILVNRDLVSAVFIHTCMSGANFSSSLIEPTRMVYLYVSYRFAFDIPDPVSK